MSKTKWDHRRRKPNHQPLEIRYIRNILVRSRVSLVYVNSITCLLFEFWLGPVECRACWPTGWQYQTNICGNFSTPHAAGNLNTMSLKVMTVQDLIKFLAQASTSKSTSTPMSTSTPDPTPMSTSTPMSTATHTSVRADAQDIFANNGIFHGETVVLLAHAFFKLQAAQTATEAAQTATAVEPGDESALPLSPAAMAEAAAAPTQMSDYLSYEEAVASSTRIISTTASAAASAGGTTASAAAASAGVMEVCGRVSLNDVLFLPNDGVYTLSYKTSTTSGLVGWVNPALPTQTMVVATIIKSNPAPVFAVSPIHVHDGEASNTQLPVRSTLRAYAVAHDGTVRLTTAGGLDAGVVVDANTPIDFDALASDSCVGSTFKDSVAVLVAAAMPRESVRIPPGWQLDFLTHVLQ